MNDAGGKTPLVPGFEFLQNLVKSAGAALPGIGQWVAPTLDPKELDKRIEELRTVQFWLEQNARMLAATIQALEVQRMTLSTLQTMNVQMGDLRETLRIKPRAAPAAVASDASDAATTTTMETPAATATTAATKKKQSRAAATAAVDPMQWWGALTQQFAELATSAMKDTAADTAKALAAQTLKASLGAAKSTLVKATRPRRAPAAKRAARPTSR